MLKIVTKQDLKKAAAIERRRKFEEERKTRIFDPRLRTIGVDFATLEKQVVERSARGKEEEAIARAWERKAVQDAENACCLHKKIEEENRAIREEIKRFYATYQRKEFSREFDLNDPDAVKKQLSARVDDEDPRCGVSSGQKFDGEDLECKARLKHQKEQLRSWVEQQEKEKHRADAQRVAYEVHYNQVLVARDERAVQIEQMQNDVKRKLNETIFHFNKALAEENAHLRDLDHYRENEMNNAEMYNAMTGDFLTENPEAHVSALGSHRVIPYMYKGMGEQQLFDVREQQQQQMQQKKMQEEYLSHSEAEWDQLVKNIGDQACVLESKLEQDKRNQNENLLKQNMQLAMEQKSHQDYLKKYVYTNKPTASYFDQFNTSSR